MHSLSRRYSHPALATHQTLAEVYRVVVTVDTEFVLSELLKQEKFSIAKKHAHILHSTASQVTVKQAELNLHKLTRSSYWNYEQVRLNFWQSCDTTFQREGVEPEQAAQFFESIVNSGIEDPSSPAPNSPETTPTDQTTSC